MPSRRWPPTLPAGSSSPWPPTMPPTGAIRHLKLNDIDLANHRITLAGCRQRCGELGHRALRCWLEYRRATWPHTDNPHVLVNPRTVHGTAPIGQVFVNRRIQRAGCTVGRIRTDRILHEALTATTGPDPLPPWR